MMKSLGAAVRISNGRPPASRTASLTTRAMPSRWLKQIASSDELLTTAILGLSMSASVSPSAFHWARRTASRGEPGSKLLRRALVMVSSNLTPPSGTAKGELLTTTQHPVQGTSLLTQPWYRNYVLLILTLCYVSNVMD